MTDDTQHADSPSEASGAQPDFDVSRLRDWEQLEPLIARSERQVIDQWAPWGDAVVGQLRAQSEGDRVELLLSLGRTLHLPAEFRIAWIRDTNIAAATGIAPEPARG